jgi:hypothetical protein
MTWRIPTPMSPVLRRRRNDNEDIPAGALLNVSGVTIDVDAPGFPSVPPGGYRYIRIWSPINWPNNDGSEIDSIFIEP